MSGSIKAALKLAKNADTLSGVSKTLKSIVKKTGDFQVSSLLKSLDVGKFASAFKITTKGIDSSSNLIDIGKKVAKYADMLPRSADDILASVSKNIDSVSDVASGLVKKSDEFTDSLDTLKAVSKLENAKTVSKMQSLTDSLTNITTSVVKGVPRRLDGVTDSLLSSADKLKSIAKKLPDAKSADEIAATLKSSKGIVKKFDDVGDVTSVVKKLDDVSDLAASAKKTKKLLNTLDKFGTLAQVGLLTGYYLGAYLNNRGSDLTTDGEEYDPLILTTDPSTNIYEVALYEDQKPTVSSSFEDILMTKEFVIFGVIISMIMVV